MDIGSIQEAAQQSGLFFIVHAVRQMVKRPSWIQKSRKRFPQVKLLNNIRLTNKGQAA